jgi:hypothetical protein
MIHYNQVHGDVYRVPVVSCEFIIDSLYDMDGVVCQTWYERAVYHKG